MAKRDGCSGKVSHKDRRGAGIEARKAGWPGMNVYRCKICKGWHIGKSRDPARSAQRIDWLINQSNGKNRNE